MKPGLKILIVGLLAVAMLVVMMARRSEPPGRSQPPSGPATRPLPRLLDAGSTTCVPCQMMAPVLEDLKREYAGRLQVEFVDIVQDEDAGRKLGIIVMPTQIFYDPTGLERFRHTGFLSKEDILAKWKELGVDLSAPAPAPAMRSGGT